MKSHHLYAVVALGAVFGTACSDSRGPSIGQRNARVVRDCVKDAEFVTDVIDEFEEPVACVLDANCPCGTYCGVTQFCTAECVTTTHDDFGCDGPKQCDNWGRCEVPVVDDVPTQQVAVLQVPTILIDLESPDPGENFFTSEVTIVLTTDDATLASDSSRHPTVTVAGSLQQTPDCADDDPTTSCVLAAYSEIEVKCQPGAAFGDECELEPAWTFDAVEDGWRAERDVWVRPVAAATGDVWELRVFSSDTPRAPARVTISRLPEVAQPFAGTYEGVVELRTGADDNVPVKIPVHAVADRGAVLLIDDARVLSPSGRLRLDPSSGPVRTTWLGSGSDARVVAELAVDSLIHDDRSGLINGGFSIELPSSSRAAGRKLSWNLVIGRIGELPGAACEVDSTCPAGSHCEPALRTCVDGNRWEPLALAAPENYLIHEPISDWLDAVWPQLVARGFIEADNITADAVERLDCAPPAGPGQDDVYGSTVLPLSGDITCAGSGSNEPVSNRLSLTDRPTTLSVGALFEQCAADLSAPVTTGGLSGSSNCLSPARVYAAVGLLTSMGLADDSRAGSMLQLFLRRWIVTHAFLAGQSQENWTLETASGLTTVLDLEEMLDRVTASWDLLLDDTVVESLGELSPQAVRNPDYRGANLPFAYWRTHGNSDSFGGVTLSNYTGSSNTLYGSARGTMGADSMSRDLTMSFSAEWDYVIDARRERTVVRSPWLSVSFEQTSPLFDKDTVRSLATDRWWFKRTGLEDWFDCRRWASEGWAHAWEFIPANGAESSLCVKAMAVGAEPWDRGDGRMGEPSYRAGAYSGIIDRHGGSGNTTWEAGYKRPGSNMDDKVVSSPEACRDWCGSGTSYSGCTAWSYRHSDGRCWKKNGELSLKTPVAGWTTGLTYNAERTERELRRVADIGYDRVGHDYRSFGGTTWHDCHATCMGEDECEAWSYSIPSKHCWLKTKAAPTNVNSRSVSGIKTGVFLVVSHETASGKPATVRFRLNDQMHAFDGDFNASNYTVVRKVAERKYLLYRDGELLGSEAFREAPHHPDNSIVRVGRPDEAGVAFMAAEDVALWNTALDEREVQGIIARRDLGLPTPRRGAPLSVPANPNHEQELGLSVTIAEGLEAELELLDEYVTSQSGAVVEECRVGDQSSLRDSMMTRVGNVLRRSLMLQGVADELHERARQVSCESHDDCAAHGGQCGPDYTQVSLQHSTASYTGAMGHCPTWTAPYGGMCVNQGVGDSISAPGAVGTGTISFSVPTAGDYAIWGRYWGIDANSDTLWVRVDDGPWWMWKARHNAAGFAWSRVNDYWGARDGVVVSLAAGTHTLTIGVREDGAYVHELLVTEHLGSAPPEELDDVCVDGEGAPVIAADAPWTERYTTTRDGLAAVRARVIQNAAIVSECRNPLGIEENDIPLYFRDVSGGSSQYFASSDYLMELATNAWARADSSLAGARSAWDSSRASNYHESSQISDLDRRMRNIAGGFEQTLADLCGTSSADSDGLLESLATGALDPNSCFVQPTAACTADFNGPIADADTACFRGQVGEALVGMKLAHQRVQSARLAWNASQNEFEGKTAICIELEQTERIVKAHYEHLEELRSMKRFYDQAAMVMDLAGGATGLLVSAYTKKNPDYRSEFDVPSDGGLRTGLGLIGGGFNLLSWNVADKIQREQEKYAATMAERSAALDVQSCFHQLDQIRDAILVAANQIEVAATDFELSASRFANLNRRIDQLVHQGQAAVAREQNRSVVRPQHHYWLDEATSSYKRDFAWAKRLVYLAMRAVEWDEQLSLGLRQNILDATSTDDLDIVLGVLAAHLGDRYVHGHSPDPNPAVVSLAADVLGYDDPNPAVRAARLREYVRDRGHRVTDSNGNVLGQGVWFVLSPDMVPDLDVRCGERLSTVTAHVDTEQASVPPRAWIRLFKRNTFSSQWCDGAPNPDLGAAQTATMRPANNLFVADVSEPFTATSTLTPADIQAPVNADRELLYGEGYAEGASTELAGRGMYGQYLLLFPATSDDIDLSAIQDVRLRFGYLSVARGDGLPD